MHDWFHLVSDNFAYHEYKKFDLPTAKTYNVLLQNKD